jgi:hypothetical protein
MGRRARVRILGFAAFALAVGFAACSLNPQPLPPATANEDASSFAPGADASPTLEDGAKNAGDAVTYPSGGGGDGSDSALDGEPFDAPSDGEASTDAPSDGRWVDSPDEGGDAHTDPHAPPHGGGW